MGSRIVDIVATAMLMAAAIVVVTIANGLVFS
jgi:hypothetical protein